MSKKIDVNAGKPYAVTVGSGILDSCGSLVAQTVPACRGAIITDSNVAPLYLSRAKESLEAAGFEIFTHVFPAGEQNKNLSTLSEILEFLAESQLTRRDCIFALGGGVTGDMAGFAAGCYLRGIKFVQLPTTVLAAVDSSVGGKTAVDLKAGKNLAGLFLQPRAVICDISCFETLSDELFADGLAEAIKAGILFDAELFENCRSARKSADMANLITRAVQWKAKIVEEDEFERGNRKLLNLGHTPAHAIEKLSDFSVSHGSAVAIGTVIMARAAEKLGIAKEPCAGRIIEMFKSNGLPVSTGYSAPELARIALSDKKRSGGEITLVFPEAVGRCVLKNYPVEALENIFAAGLE